MALAALFFRVESIWLLLPLAFVFWTTAATPITPDAWWTLATGRSAPQTRILPTADPFTFPPAPFGFVDPQWLAQRLFFTPYPAFGLAGVGLVDAAIGTAT